MDTARLTVTPLSPDDTERVAAAVEVENATIAADSPWVHPDSVERLQARLRYGWDLEPAQHFTAAVDDQVVAVGYVHTPQHDNLDLAWMGVTVHPEHRHQGIGSAVVEELMAVSTALGRTKFGADCWDGHGFEGFVERFGFTRGSQAINRRQHLAELDRAELARLHEQALEASAAYELLRLPGRTPEDLLEAVTEMSAAINDAPLDDLALEDDAFSVQRTRDYETAREKSGDRLYRLVARHRETGELAGHTVVAVESARPAVGHQHDTSVVRAHRGHRLGLLLKSGMNLWLDEVEPQVETVDTWNAESNDHMIGVNELLRYRWMGRGLQFQRLP